MSMPVGWHCSLLKLHMLLVKSLVHRLIDGRTGDERLLCCHAVDVSSEKELHEFCVSALPWH